MEIQTNRTKVPNMVKQPSSSKEGLWSDGVFGTLPEFDLVPERTALVVKNCFLS